MASIRECREVRDAATRHWREATEQLAEQLGLPAWSGPSAPHLAVCRRARLAQHLQVVRRRRLHRMADLAHAPPRQLLAEAPPAISATTGANPEPGTGRGRRGVTRRGHRTCHAL